MVTRAAVPAALAVVFAVCEATVTAALAIQPARNAATRHKPMARSTILSTGLVEIMLIPRTALVAAPKFNPFNGSVAAQDLTQP